MLNINKTGCTVGVVLGGWHLLWSVLVATGIAQAVLNFVFWIHFLTPPYTVEPFAVGRALSLVAVTVLLGYGLGAVIAALWNRIHR